MILDYIRKNSPENHPKITKSDVMKHLKDSRMMTTHKTTVQLIKEDKIKIVRPKHKPYSDYLVINEENEFIHISKELSEIEALIDKMHNAIKKMKITMRKMKTEKNEMEEIVNFGNNFMRSYYDACDLMLHVLLGRIKTKIHSEIDKNILYGKTIEILGKLHHDFSPWLDAMELDHIVDVKLKNVRSSSVFETLDFDISLIDDIMQVIKNFKNQLLSEQKTTEPGEK